ncbi:J domain-containing protein [Streptacidiphilus melanogenes]|uniref:J domain-containing protein n=1 Tax=Streptacidiphilus melanogenes TaxID=411235 RepID=UPI000A074041|nr:J domain-containing protein [Streptacidiphilus melanogenes]
MTREPPGPPPDPYRVLGVEPGARQAEVRRAYRARAKSLHPDTNPRPDAPDHLARVVDAYRRLIQQDADRTAPPPDPATQPPPSTHSPRPRGATIVAGPVRIQPLPPA